jgi:hypothetical protein
MRRPDGREATNAPSDIIEEFERQIRLSPREDI